MKPGVYIGNLKNPSNRGTCIRTGESFGINLFLTNDDTTDYRYSQGTSNHVIFLKFSTEKEVIDYCNKNHHKIVCIENTPDALDMQDVNYPSNPLFITGNENEGVSKEFLKSARMVIKIPQADTYCRCLNTGVACSIILQDWFNKNKNKQILIKNNNAKYGNK